MGLRRYKNSYGARLLKDWLEKPLLYEAEINPRLDAVEELTKNPLLLNDFREILKNIYDLERLIGKISYGNANPRDLAALKNSLKYLPEIFRLFSYGNADLFKEFFDSMDLLEDIKQLIEDTLKEDLPVSPKEGGLSERNIIIKLMN